MRVSDSHLVIVDITFITEDICEADNFHEYIVLFSRRVRSR